MRIAILTFHRAANCGAVLQAWALQTVLRQLGHEAMFPAVNQVGNEEGRIYYLRRVPYWRTGIARLAVIVKRALLDMRRLGREPLSAARYREFRERFLSECGCTVDALPYYVDLAVIGSDQVWNQIMLDNDEPLFLAETIPADLPLVSYAASCGDNELPEGFLRRLAAQLPRFKAVSVRETFAREQIARCWSGAVEVVADPTLLLTAADFAPLVADVPHRARPYLYVYSIHASDELLALARAVARQLGLELVVQISTPLDRDAARPDDVYETNVTPDRMVAAIAGAAGVIAASFHGTALALIFGKPLASVGNFTFMKLGRRQRELLASVGLEDWMITVEEAPGRVAELLCRDLPREAFVHMEEIRRRSRDWLEKAVESARAQ